MLNQRSLIEVVKTILNHPILFMVYTTHKNGDFGMVYYSFTHISEKLSHITIYYGKSVVILLYGDETFWILFTVGMKPWGMKHY